MTEQECLSGLSNALERIESPFSEFATTAMLSAMMVLKEDEIITLNVTKDRLNTILILVPHARDLISSIITLCPNSAIINVKSQLILNLLADLPSAVRPVAQRLGVRVPF
jgi:hypothetical protein